MPQFLFFMISAIILSGGIGTRMRSTTPKQYLQLSRKPIALHSLHLLKASPLISEIIIVCDKEFEQIFPHDLFAPPGPRRQDSLYNGLQLISPKATHILIHDAARPLLNPKDLENLIQAGLKHSAATLATSVKTTIKKAGDNLFVEETLDRNTLFEIQTPQIIRKDLLEKGFSIALEKNITVTDDVSLVELFNHPVKLVIGSEDNIKITTPKDLVYAENACQI